jgi:putative membrane protein
MFMRGFGFYGPWGWVGMVISLIVVAVIVIGVILLIVSAVRRGNVAQATSTGLPQTPAAPTPREIAQARYARGEITREEYVQILEDIGK